MSVLCEVTVLFAIITPQMSCEYLGSVAAGQSSDPFFENFSSRSHLASRAPMNSADVLYSIRGQYTACVVSNILGPIAIERSGKVFLSSGSHERG
jgi:hypothetical protein